MQDLSQDSMQPPAVSYPPSGLQQQCQMSSSVSGMQDLLQDSMQPPAVSYLRVQYCKRVSPLSEEQQQRCLMSSPSSVEPQQRSQRRSPVSEKHQQQCRMSSRAASYPRCLLQQQCRMRSPFSEEQQQRSQRRSPVSEEQQQPQPVPQSDSVQLDQAHAKDQAPVPRRPAQARGFKRSFSISLLGVLLSFMFVFFIMDTDHLAPHDQGNPQVLPLLYTHRVRC